jgi:hypothetical protein
VSNAFATVKMRNAASPESDAEKTGVLEDEVKVEDGAEIAEIRSTLKPRSPESPDEEENFRTAIPESVDTRNPKAGVFQRQMRLSHRYDFVRSETGQQRT